MRASTESTKHLLGARREERNRRFPLSGLPSARVRQGTHHRFALGLHDTWQTRIPGLIQSKVSLPAGKDNRTVSTPPSTSLNGGPILVVIDLDLVRKLPEAIPGTPP